MNQKVLLLLTLLVACRGTETVAPQLGALHVDVTASGVDVDRDGFVLSVDTVLEAAVAANGSYEISGLVQGEHVVQLTAVTPNCTGSTPLQQMVEILPDSMIRVAFTLVCTKAPLTATALIAFARADTDHTWNLWVMNGDGTGAIKLRDSPGVSEFQPTWTPDGQHILFVSGSTIRRLDRSGSAFTGFTHLADSAYSPNVDANGQRVVFAKDVGGYDIWVMNGDGTNPQPLTTDPAYEDHPTWSPDGSQIVFERGYILFVMNADGTNQHRISSPDAIEDRWPTWSPDGTRILFTRRGFGQDHIYTIRPDGTGLTPLTSGLDNDDFPTWSGDGSRILFSSGRGGFLAIWSMRPDGTDLRRLSAGPPTPYDSDPAVSR